MYLNQLFGTLKNVFCSEVYYTVFVPAYINELCHRYMYMYWKALYCVIIDIYN